MLDCSALDLLGPLSGRYQYTRVGFDGRVLDLFPDGTIGEGAASLERMWYPTNRGDEQAIVVAGDFGVQFTAFERSPGEFSGDWMRIHPCGVRLNRIHNSIDDRVRQHVWFNGETAGLPRCHFSAFLRARILAVET